MRRGRQHDGQNPAGLLGRLFILISILCFPSYSQAIEPELQNCTLQVANQTLKPIEVINPWRMTYKVGTNRFFVAGNTVQRPATVGHDFLWTAKSDDGSSLNWLGATTNIAFLLGYNTSENGRLQEYDFPPRVRRLDLRTGNWLADLSASAGLPGDLEVKSVLELQVSADNRVVLLTGLGKREPSKSRGGKIEAYSLSFLDEGGAEPIWTKQFPSEGERPYTGGYVWGIPAPLYAGSSLRRLSWLGERLLVCPESMQPIYCLNPDTGSEIWHLERMWEVQRGFIGPSVWSHFISRFGISEFEAAKTNFAQQRKTFEQGFQCALAGGPLSVSLTFERGEDTHSMFMALVKGPANRWAGYLSDCVVYELGDDGKPVSMGTLPWMVDGSRSCTRGNEVIWKCQHETFVKFSPSRNAPVVSMGGGGSEGNLNLVWARHVAYQKPQAWFVSGKAGDPVAFGEAWGYCVPDGGYVLRKGDKRFCFPIAAVDLYSGLDASFVLSVPFHGEFSLPANNMSTETIGNGIEFHRALNPHLLAVTGLDAYGNELEITIATESAKWGLTFDVAKALSALARVSQVRTNDSRSSEGVRARAGPGGLDEALQHAASGNDATEVNALLKAGANAKYASDQGWTALMVAAAYGNADMVGVLIAAGADVNAADKNCGGQTVLMWAARSRREAKQKIRSLLKAGAKLNGASDNGYNALMSAAGEGDIEAVECLLQAGSDIATRDHQGGTALMAAARSGKGNVASAMIKRGAEINAKDSQGMTALMRAAEHVDSVRAIEVLLSAGANPNLKDSKGRTALSIAQKLNIPGAEQVIELLKSVTTEH
jgi:ankyrin repeat protein